MRLFQYFPSVVMACEREAGQQGTMVLRYISRSHPGTEPCLTPGWKSAWAIQLAACHGPRLHSQSVSPLLSCMWPLTEDATATRGFHSTGPEGLDWVGSDRTLHPGAEEPYRDPGVTPKCMFPVATTTFPKGQNKQSVTEVSGGK